MSAASIKAAVVTLLQSVVDGNGNPLIKTILTQEPRQFTAGQPATAVVWITPGPEQRIASGNGAPGGPQQGVKIRKWVVTTHVVVFLGELEIAGLAFDNLIEQIEVIYRQNIGLPAAAVGNYSHILNFAENLNPVVAEPQAVGTYQRFEAMIDAAADEWINA